MCTWSRDRRWEGDAPLRSGARSDGATNCVALSEQEPAPKRRANESTKLMQICVCVFRHLIEVSSSNIISFCLDGLLSYSIEVEH
jgi:hypothetical protein